MAMTIPSIDRHRPKTKILSMNNELCVTSPTTELNHQRKTIIVVLSTRNHFNNRQLIRQTYGSIKTANNVTILAIAFLLGNSQDVDLIESIRLQAEIDQFNDIIVGDFVDSYRNLSRKTIMGYEWVTTHCRETQFIVKTDDDVLVNIFQLTKEIDSWSEADVASSKIWCMIDRNEPTVKIPNSRFYASPVDFPDGTFPEHCEGMGYVTSIGVIDRIVDEITKSFPGRICTHEDVFITGIVPQYVNARRTVDPIERVDRKREWRSIALETGGGDEDHFLRNMLTQESDKVENENLIEFRRRYNTKVFHLLSHTDDFTERYLRLWELVRLSFSN